MTVKRTTPIREWDYDDSGLEVSVTHDGRVLAIRQFDGHGEMTVLIFEARHARKLAATLEVYASREEGKDAIAKMTSARFRARLEAELARERDPEGPS